MLYTELTKTALRIAYDAHHGQTDKTGLPYIYHPLHLAEHIGDDEMLIATALLHDVVEDTDITFGELSEHDITAEVIEALKLLTHDDDVPYMEYVTNIKDSGNATAIAVKLADLRHNSDTWRLTTIGDAAKARIEKYKQAIGILEPGDKMKFKDKQQKRGEKLIQDGFFGDAGDGVFMGKPRLFVLKDGLNNLHPSIRKDVLAYFEKNGIVWWGGSCPTGHVLSSQIACLNHLFPIRQDKDAVLNLLKSVTDDFVEVLPIAEEMPGYVMFEAVGGPVNYLNERTNTRGSNCTSVDAFVYAVHKDGRRFLIPIEWKYIEAYSNDDKSAGSKGGTRKSRYLDLIADSKYVNDNTLSCCWFEPFYQLMRQTLWAEQVLAHKPEGFEAVDYLHLHVIPDANAELLDRKYPCSGKGMKDTWKSCLTNPSKYIVLSPEKLWSHQDEDSEIYKYLKARYW